MGKEGQKRGGRGDQRSKVPWAQGSRVPGPRQGHIFTAAGLPRRGRWEIKGEVVWLPRPSWGLHRGEDGAMTARAPVFVIKSKWGPLLSWGWLVAPAASSCGCRRRGRLPVAEAEQGLLVPLVSTFAQTQVCFSRGSGRIPSSRLWKRPSPFYFPSCLGCQELPSFLRVRVILISSSSLLPLLYRVFYDKAHHGLSEAGTAQAHVLSTCFDFEQWPPRLRRAFSTDAKITLAAD